jgi:cytochrome c-type biogenesis protein CcmH
MAVFWTLAALMTAAALAFVLVPLLLPRHRDAADNAHGSLDLLREQRREIDADIANGTVPAEAREEILAEFIGRAREELAGPGSAPRAPSSSWKVAAGLAFVLPAFAVATYLAVGNPAAATAGGASTAAAQQNESRAALVDRLARSVKERPDDVKSWALLASSLATLERLPEAAAAHANLARLSPGNADVLADYAEALGMAQGGTLVGTPRQIAQTALGIDPAHRKALAIAATAALDAGDSAQAVRHLQALIAQLPKGSPDEVQAQAMLAEARDAAGAARKGPVSTSGKGPVRSDTAISGSVALAAGISAGLSGNETVFVFARNEAGSGPPLAVLRMAAREWPRAFSLDDSHGMAPGLNLSSARAVRIEARISRSGNARPQPGDLVGVSPPVRPGSRDVRIVVDRELR